MINVTRLNRSSLILNCDLIEYIEYTPDTVITLTNDRKITVQETAEEVVERIRALLLVSGPRVSGPYGAATLSLIVPDRTHGRRKTAAQKERVPPNPTWRPSEACFWPSVASPGE